MRLDTEFLNAIGVAITAFATVLLVIATALLARATNRLNHISEELKSTQHNAALTQALNVVNFTILSRDENLATADALIGPAAANPSIEKSRERWISFLLLNVESLIFATREQDESFRRIWEATQHGVLDYLLKNDNVMEVLRTRGYTREFIEYCEARRRELLRDSGKQ
ncbi:MAG TPA: hypothetical protein VF753_21580 [Terriglobales bacterium]